MARGEARGRTRVIELAAARPGMRILDLACGPGNLSRRLAAQVAPGGEVIGVDLAPGMIELARAADIPNARFEVMDIEQLAFGDATFAATGCSSPPISGWRCAKHGGCSRQAAVSPPVFRSRRCRRRPGICSTRCWTAGSRPEQRWSTRSRHARRSGTERRSDRRRLMRDLPPRTLKSSRKSSSGIRQSTWFRGSRAGGTARPGWKP
jgi:SAM-dependent methyltransferase